MPWIRNGGFIAICLVALAATLGRFLPSDLQTPTVKVDQSRYSEPDFLRTLETLNAEFAAQWKDADVTPTPTASEHLIYRRLSLGLTGTLPSLEELRSLERVDPDQRPFWWLEHLFADRRFSDYVAERLARSYVGTEDGPFLVFRRRRFVTWLSDQLAANRPYDSIVRELIGGTGIWTDSPSVNFLTVTNDVNGDEQPDEERLAARTARAFLGFRLDCVQCHDDHLSGDWLQSDFQQLAAFYADASSSLLGITDDPQDYEFQYLGKGESETVEACVPFEPKLVESHDGITRREQLANWVTHPDNIAFSRAITNRVWALLFGRPLVSPVDNLPLNGPFPPGMETLAKDFRDHSFDLQRLIRLIALSEPFQRSSRGPQAVTARQEETGAAFPVTRLRPEQVAGSILQAASLTTIDAESHILVRLGKHEEQKEFVKRYGDTGEDEFVDRAGTIPQRLLLMNGQLVRERTKDDLVKNAVTRIAALVDSDERAIDTAYWIVLIRRPSINERAYFMERMNEQTGNARRAVLEDLVWALFNSTEFQVNH